MEGEKNAPPRNKLLITTLIENRVFPVAATRAWNIVQSARPSMTAEDILVILVAYRLLNSLHCEP